MIAGGFSRNWEGGMCNNITYVITGSQKNIRYRPWKQPLAAELYHPVIH